MDLFNHPFIFCLYGIALVLLFFGIFTKSYRNVFSLASVAVTACALAYSVLKGVPLAESLIIVLFLVLFSLKISVGE